MEVGLAVSCKILGAKKYFLLEPSYFLVASVLRPCVQRILPMANRVARGLRIEATSWTERTIMKAKSAISFAR